MENKIKKLVQTKVRNKTLQIFKVGCDKINFKIIELLIKNKKLTMKNLEIELGLTTKPVYNRVNDLIKVGLINRENGVITPTDILYEFNKLIVDLMNQVEDEIYSLIEKET